MNNLFSLSCTVMLQLHDLIFTSLHVADEVISDVVCVQCSLVQLFAYLVWQGRAAAAAVHRGVERHHLLFSTSCRPLLPLPNYLPALLLFHCRALPFVAVHSVR